MQGPPIGDMEQPRQPYINTVGARQGQSLLTPITERSSIPTRENTVDGHLDSLNSPSIASPTDTDSRNRSISGVMASGNHSPLPASPSLAAAILAVTSNQTGSSGPPATTIATIPAEPPAAARPSQAFESHLSPIVGSAPTSPPTTSENAAPQLPPPSSSPRVPSIHSNVVETNAEDSALSPRAFAERAWSDATSATGAPQIKPNGSLGGRQTPEQFFASPSTMGGHPTSPFQPPRRNTASPSPERPPSIATQPRAPSPLRASTGGSVPPQRITSPLAKSPILPPIATHQQQLAPAAAPSVPESQSTTPYGDELPPMYGSDAVYSGSLQEKFAPPPEKKELPKPEAPAQSPVSTYSYPAGAEMQTPDLHEPQPKPSRTSHSAVLNAPFMVRDYKPDWPCY